MTGRAIPVILDTDIGSDIDDTWALALLLKCPELDLKMVLTDTGDTVYRAKLAAKFLQVAGRAGIPIGIGLPFEDRQKFQEDWVKDYALSGYPGPVHQDGIQAFIDLVMASAERITLIAISSAPNLAAALDREPRIKDKLRVVGMFGSVYKGYDGQPGAVPEANVKYHNGAFQKFFAGFPDLSITPLDTCGLVKLKGQAYQAVLNCPDPMIRALMDLYRLWAENVTWERGIDTQARSSTLFDTVAVLLAFNEDFFEMREMGLSVDGEGLMRVDEAGRKVRVAIEWKDLEAYQAWLVQRLCGKA